MATETPPPVEPAPVRTGLPPTPSIARRRQALEWILRPEQLMRRGRDECGDPFTLHLPVGPAVLVSDPAAIKAVFTGDPGVLRAGEGNAPLEPILGPRSVLLLDGLPHLRQRRLLLPPFHGDRLVAYARDMEAIARDDLAGWPRGRTFALEPRMRAITLEVILRVVFGIADAGRLARLRRLFGALLPTGLGRFALLPAFRRDAFPPWRRFLATRAQIDRILYDEIARRLRAAAPPSRGPRPGPS
jgi:cytochrome P450